MAASPSKSLSNPSLGPVYTAGNAFWQDCERFLIKGISYIPRSPESQSHIDPLTEDCLDDLKRDIEVFRQLGLNTIQVTSLDPSCNHDKAMKLLAEAEIYVLVKIFEGIEKPNISHGRDFDFDTSAYYPKDLVKTALSTVDEFADYVNTLGFVVSGDAMIRPAVSKIAEVSRAAIRDIKAFLKARGSRQPPVGISVNQIMEIQMQMLQYFTASPSVERADFFSPDCWSWANPSTFMASGWKNLVKAFKHYPVPMFLAAYGPCVNIPRRWEEIECLYSPDMTGVFSGGCLYTYFEYGNHYGIVEIDDEGKVQKKPEFENLLKHFNVVNRRPQEEVYHAKVRDYENWVGTFPNTSNKWHATPRIPKFQGDWDKLLQDMKDEKEWEMVNESDDFETSNLAEGEGQQDEIAYRFAKARVSDQG